MASSSTSAHSYPSNPRRRTAPSPNNSSSSSTSPSSHPSRSGIEPRASKLPRVSSSSVGPSSVPSSASAHLSSISDSLHPLQPSVPLSAPPSNPPPTRSPEQPVVCSGAAASTIEAIGVRILPGSLADAELGDVLVMVGDMLTRLLEHNDRLPLPAQRGQSLTRFHSRAIPSITVRDYLVRIARYTPLEKVCVLLVLVYIDRIAAAQASQPPLVPSDPSSTSTSHSTGDTSVHDDVGIEGESRGEEVEVEGEGPSWTAPLQPSEARFTLCSLTVHRFVCAAIVCSSKALCDSFATNAHYSRVGGISLQELNVLERELMRLIRWRLAVRLFFSLCVFECDFFGLGAKLLTPTVCLYSARVKYWSNTIVRWSLHTQHML